MKRVPPSVTMKEEVERLLKGAAVPTEEGVLSAYALLEDGRAVLLHLDLGPRESFDAWLSVPRDMTARGLSDPLMVIFDGNPGLKKAIRRVWPRAFRSCAARPTR